VKNGILEKEMVATSRLAWPAEAIEKLKFFGDEGVAATCFATLSRRRHLCF
jgi:hypothetical protein